MKNENNKTILRWKILKMKIKCKSVLMSRVYLTNKCFRFKFKILTNLYLSLYTNTHTLYFSIQQNKSNWFSFAFELLKKDLYLKYVLFPICIHISNMYFIFILCIFSGCFFNLQLIQIYCTSYFSAIPS